MKTLSGFWLSDQLFTSIFSFEDFSVFLSGGGHEPVLSSLHSRCVLIGWWEEVTESSCPLFYLLRGEEKNSQRIFYGQCQWLWGGLIVVATIFFWTLNSDLFWFLVTDASDLPRIRDVRADGPVTVSRGTGTRGVHVVHRETSPLRFPGDTPVRTLTHTLCNRNLPPNSA